MSKNIPKSRTSKNCDTVKTTYDNWFLWIGIIISILGGIILYYNWIGLDSIFGAVFYTGLILIILGLLSAFLASPIANNRKKKCEQS